MTGVTRDGAQNELLVYDSTTDSWTMGPSMPTGRAEMSGAIVGHMLYVLGGRQDHGRQASIRSHMEVYNIVEDSWSTAAQSSTIRDSYGMVAAH